MVLSRAVARRPRVLVFHKRPASPRLRAGAAGRPVVAGFREARRDHETALVELEAILARLPIDARYVPLPTRVRGAAPDLVIALGGDGTVLHASHQIGETPVLAINSSPRHSVGYLTATDIRGAEAMIARALEGGLEETRLQRMAVEVDGKRAYSRVLNDALFSHVCPASTARYDLGLGGAHESQMSSGIWVGTAAGSTAALKAAGGRILPPRSRKLQFVVREPYLRHGVPYALTRGLVPPGERLEIRSHMDEARLYVDGPHIDLRVRLGQTVALTLSDEPLLLLGFHRPPHDGR